MKNGFWSLTRCIVDRLSTLCMNVVSLSSPCTSHSPSDATEGEEEEEGMEEERRTTTTTASHIHSCLEREEIYSIINLNQSVTT